jgi:ATP-dependent Clp protease adaptor protein ClpS
MSETAPYSAWQRLALQPNLHRSPEGPGNEQEREGDRGVALEVERPETAPPPMYKVLLLNDDYTPMAFVEFLLQKFFGLSDELAHRVMMTVHTQGRGVCGVYSKEIAETKVSQVNNFARQHQHPLLCVMEAA